MSTAAAAPMFSQAVPACDGSGIPALVAKRRPWACVRCRPLLLSGHPQWPSGVAREGVPSAGRRRLLGDVQEGWTSRCFPGSALPCASKRDRVVRVHAASKSSGVRYPFPRSRDLVDLPLFPLPLVLFPGQVMPLQIFEYRYRIMMHTLLQTDLRFGVVFAGAEKGTAAAIGCVGEVHRHTRQKDDCFQILCKGQQRFRVVDIVRTKPYLVGRVEWLEDRPPTDPAPGEHPDQLAKEVEGLMKDVIRLSNKVSGKSPKDETEDLRKNAFATPFSFWVASTFEGAPLEQQALLELVDTAERLKRERTTLKNTLNYLTAATAVKDVFKSSSLGDPPEGSPPESPPTGGPD